MRKMMKANHSQSVLDSTSKSPFFNMDSCNPPQTAIFPDQRLTVAYLAIPINGMIEPQLSQDCLLCDPLTGLVSYPSFETFLTSTLPELLNAGLHLAIGDVDNLRDYILAKNIADPYSSGHLAGNDCMRRVGKAIRDWTNGISKVAPFLMCATFGGDEVIIAGSGLPYHQFFDEITSLSKQIAMAAPRSCSFAVSTTTNEEMHVNPGNAELFYKKYLGNIDRHLLQQKAAMSNNKTKNGFVFDLGNIKVGENQ
jgi:GGDEF domain-containing protein